MTDSVESRDGQANLIMGSLGTAATIAEQVLLDGVSGDEAEVLRRLIANCDDLSQLVLDTFPNALAAPDTGHAIV